MGFACFGQDFNAFPVGFQLDLEGISMGLEGIPLHFQLIFNGIWKEFQLGLEGIPIACGWMSILLGWIPMHSGSISNAF